MAEFFFADANGEFPKDLDLKEVDMIYNDYIRVMSTMHEKLRNLYNKYVLNILDERARKEHNLKPYNLRLVLPGEDDDFAKMFENEEDN